MTTNNLKKIINLIATPNHQPDFPTNHSTEQIRERTTKLVDRSMHKGGIAIGSGNSIPDYIPIDHHCAMVEAVLRWT